MTDLQDLSNKATQGEWKPIETAPRDGTVIDIWAVIPGTDYSDRHENVHWDRAWINYGDWNISNDGWEATHWMPLPPAPQGGE